MKKSFIALAGALALSSNVAFADDDWNTFAVTVTNASTHHVLTPPLVVAHKRQFSLFNIGTEASEGLAALAEGGDTSILQAESEDTHMIFSTATGSGLIFPGKSMTIEIQAPKYAKISLASMLAGTNDAFIGIKNLDRKSKGAMVPWVLDAGSEMNNEDCDYIPGPPCHENEKNMRTDGGEGMVSLHKGIHGGGNLDPTEMDWRTGVATVTLMRKH